MASLKATQKRGTQLRGLLLKLLAVYLVWSAYVWGPPEFRAALLWGCLIVAVVGGVLKEAKNAN